MVEDALICLARAVLAGGGVDFALPDVRLIEDAIGLRYHSASGAKRHAS